MKEYQRACIEDAGSTHLNVEACTPMEDLQCTGENYGPWRRCEEYLEGGLGTLHSTPHIAGPLHPLPAKKSPC